MKYLKVTIIFFVFICGNFSCKKNIEETRIKDAVPSVLNTSVSTLLLTENQSKDTLFQVSWTAADFGFSSATQYTVQMAKGGTNFAKITSVNMSNLQLLKYTGEELNNLAIANGILAGTSGSLDVRVKAYLSDSIFVYSNIKTVALTSYKVSLPALLVKGGNSWVTPAARNNGFLLTSANYNGKYEGYLYLPNADGWGGDAFKLISSINGTVYGWGSSATTMSVNGGNLWLSPAPNYMKVNADVDALTISFTPIKFFVVGDHNGWSTSTATPMTYNSTTKTLEATVTFAAGNKFDFVSSIWDGAAWKNPSWDICYKINAAGDLVFAGNPVWGGNSILVANAGTYKVILDLSGGDGNYKYLLQ